MTTQCGAAVGTRKFLDDIYLDMDAGRVRSGMGKLFAGLRERRLLSSEAEWTDLVARTILTHPLKEVLHQDPVTRWCYSKPRGYAGDAVLLDMLYRSHTQELADASDVTSQIFAFLCSEDAARAVRARRHFIARAIDAVAHRNRKPRIMSLACGHLREVKFSSAFGERRFDAFYALDQDPESLQEVARGYNDYGVTADNISVRDILRGKGGLPPMDFIYSSGLYDYLEQKVARRLTRRLFDMLADGGVLLLTNFLPGISAVGYMESYMAWRLIYRDESEMMGVLQGVPRRQIDRVIMSVERRENIVYLKVHKRALGRRVIAVPANSATYV